MAPEESKDIAVPAMVGFVGAGVAALGFGAGYGARSYRSSVAYKELMEKFPRCPQQKQKHWLSVVHAVPFLGVLRWQRSWGSVQ